MLLDNFSCGGNGYQRPMIQQRTTTLQQLPIYDRNPYNKVTGVSSQTEGVSHTLTCKTQINWPLSLSVSDHTLTETMRGGVFVEHLLSRTRTPRALLLWTHSHGVTMCVAKYKGRYNKGFFGVFNSGVLTSFDEWFYESLLSLFSIYTIVRLYYL